MLAQRSIRWNVCKLWEGHDRVRLLLVIEHFQGLISLLRRSYVTTQVDANRAKIRMIHDNTELTVSEDEATRAEEEVKRRLLTSKRLSLVVDLDQTIIHATVDPTVAEWQKDPENPNYEALKDVKAFQLVDDGPGGRGTWYYIKMRPGLKQFLEEVSKLYELHIYTMGTRAYAQHIAELVDPDRKIFGDRILSRDESGSLVAKNLQRLFPVDTNMVVVIDDRGDVWNWNPNLIKVTQFSFFIGIGDINSSFLPKRQPKIRAVPKPPKIEAEAPKEESVGGPSIAEPDTAPQSPPEKQQPDDKNGAPETPATALEQLVAMGGGDNPATLQEQTAKQDEALNAQLQERPLMQMQQKLDAEDESDSESEKPRHHLLNNNDNELYHLERSLRKVHTEFFNAYASRMADAKGGRLAEIRGAASASKKPQPSANLDLALIPDIKVIMPSIKMRALASVVIVFSGVIPLDIDVHSAEISVWARSFGARIQDKISGKTTTHVVAARNRTAKVRQAVRRGKGRIKVVSFQWLMDSIIQWTKLDETPYLLKTEAEDLGRPLPGEEDEILSESEEVSSTHDTDTDANNTENEESTFYNNGTAEGPTRQRLRLNIKPPPAQATTSPYINGTTTTTAVPPTDPAAMSAPPANPDQEDSESLSAFDPTDLAEVDRSPVGGTDADWKSMHDEMAEFLGSEAGSDDSDSDSERSRSGSRSRSRSVSLTRRPKRVREEDDEEAGDIGSQDNSPAKKKAKSGLATEVAQDGDDEDGKENEGEGDGDDPDDDDLEREIEKDLAEGPEEEDEEDGGKG